MNNEPEQVDDFEYAGDGLWIDGVWYPPVFGGDETGYAGEAIDSPSNAPGTQIHPGQWFGPNSDFNSTFGNFNFSGDQINAFMRQLGLGTIPTQEAQFTEGINRATAQAGGSIPAITSTLLPQIADMRRQLNSAFESISKRLGPRGGGQIQAQEGAALGDFGKALQGLLAQGVLGGQQNLFSQLSGFRPILTAQLPQLTSAEQPFNFAQAGQSLQNIAQYGNQIFGQPSTNPYVGASGYAPLNTSGSSPFAAGPYQTVDF